MEFTDWLSIFAILSSIVSLIITFNAKKDAVNSAKNNALVMQTKQNEESLVRNPQLLKLYGINLNELEKHNITTDELLFIWSDFRQGEIYHCIEGYKSDNMLTEYRRNFLENQKVQLVFNKFIYGRLISKSNYTNTIKQYIDSL